MFSSHNCILHIAFLSQFCGIPCQTTTVQAKNLQAVTKVSWFDLWNSSWNSAFFHITLFLVTYWDLCTVFIGLSDLASPPPHLFFMLPPEQWFKKSVLFMSPKSHDAPHGLTNNLILSLALWWYSEVSPSLYFLYTFPITFTFFPYSQLCPPA